MQHAAHRPPIESHSSAMASDAIGFGAPQLQPPIAQPVPSPVAGISMPGCAAFLSLMVGTAAANAAEPDTPVADRASTRMLLAERQLIIGNSTMSTWIRLSFVQR